MKIILSLITLLTSSFVFVENPCGLMTPRGGDQDWGVGLCFIPLKTTLPIYDSKTLSPVGNLNRTKSSSIILFDKKGNKLDQIRAGIEFIGHYEMTFLKVKLNTINEDYFIINWKSEKHKYLLKKSDLASNMSTFYTYQELLISRFLPEQIEKYRNWATLGINASKTCLNLRKVPSINGEKIACIRGNDWSENSQTRVKILEVSDKWAKLEVRLMVLDQEAIDNGFEGECWPFKLDRELTGWIKFIDDDGFPNLWYSVTSY